MASLGQQTIFLHAQHKASDRALLYRVRFEGLHVLAGFCRSWLSAMTSLTFTQEAHELRVVAAPSGGVPSRLGRWINGRSFTRNGRCNKGGQCPGQHRCGQLRPLSQRRAHLQIDQTWRCSLQSKGQALRIPSPGSKTGRSVCRAPASLSSAFLFCGWRCITVDLKLDTSHNKF